MSSSLSNLADNLAEGLNKDKCESNLQYMAVNNDSLIFKCIDCNKKNGKDFDEYLARIFQVTHNSLMQTSIKDSMKRHWKTENNFAEA